MINLNCRVVIILAWIFFSNVQQSNGQDQKIADSLKLFYQVDTLKGVLKLELLRNLAFNEINDFDLALKYAEELIQLAQKENNTKFLSYGYFQKGNKKRFIGDLEEALQAYFKSAEIAKEERLTSTEGSAYAAIADVYSVSENHENAISYYGRAIKTLRRNLRNQEDSILLATSVLNAGDEFLLNKKYDSALVYFEESSILFEKVD